MTTTAAQTQATCQVFGSEASAGDRLLYLGQFMTLVSLEPYTGPLASLLGAGTQVATMHNGAEITLPAAQRFTVADDRRGS